MKLPTAEEIKKPLGKTGGFFASEEVLRLRGLALRSLEMLVGYPINEATRTEKLLLVPGSFRLKEFPVRNARIGKMQLDLTPNLGIIYTELPASSYDVNYEVGYRAGDLPAIVVSAITNITRTRMSPDPEYREQALAEIEVLRMNRAKQVRARENG